MTYRTHSLTTYRCYGPVRGGCGHKHRSLWRARVCANEDARDCKKQGGYSDRAIEHYDCSPLTVDENAWLDDIIRGEDR